MRFINNNLYPLVAALLLVIATSLWFARREPAPPQPPKQTPDTWQLPAPGIAPAASAAEAVKTIKERKLWGLSPQDIAAAAPPPPQWHIVGIARNGAERFVLLALDGKPVSQLVVGDALPNGLKITKIEDDRFFVLTPEKKKIVFGMYKDDTTK